MNSYRHFTPGNKSNSKRVIAYNTPIGQEVCNCYESQSKKYAGNPNNGNLTYNQKVSVIVNTYQGGKVQYGNFYLGEPLRINYLGRAEGQAGGSGAPLRNRF